MSGANVEANPIRNNLKLILRIWRVRVCFQCSETICV